MSSRYELVELEKALAERKAGVVIAKVEKAAENRFSYLLKANVFNYSDFFIGAHDGDVRSLILQVNGYLRQKPDDGHLLLANIDITADGFWAYLFQKYKKKEASGEVRAFGPRPEGSKRRQKLSGGENSSLQARTLPVRAKPVRHPKSFSIGGSVCQKHAISKVGPRKHPRGGEGRAG